MGYVFVMFARFSTVYRMVGSLFGVVLHKQTLV